MKEKVIDTKAGDLITKVADKVAGLANNYSEEEQLHLAKRLRYSASVISMGLGIVKTKISHREQDVTKLIEMIENSLLEVINNLKIALIREYINKDDYDEVYSMIGKLYRRLITLRKLLHSN